MGVKDRLLLFLKHIKMGQGKFEDQVGLSKGFVTNIGKGINSVSLNKISKQYPELNTNWLLTGEGDMHNNDTGKPKPGDVMNPGIALTLAILDDYISWKAKETGGDYKVLKAAVFEKANTILRNFDGLPFGGQFGDQ